MVKSYMPKIGIKNFVKHRFPKVATKILGLPVTDDHLTAFVFTQFSRTAKDVVSLLLFSDNASKHLPIPPPNLITLVAGTADVFWFLEGGRRGAKSMLDILKKNGVMVKSLGAILDFGCGCGRVIRHLSSLKHTQVCGTDYNQQLIDWCKGNYPFATFRTNHLAPPLDYRDGEFDMVYALSVFTHLTETLQHQWINELYRVLKPDGYLLISTHGEYYLNQLTLREQQIFAMGRLVVRDEVAAGTNNCSAYHPTTYVRETLTKGFQLVDFVKEGAAGNPYQDLYLLKKL